jgi:exopolysaccharide biosynthesis polyprenyl glycosylphosphotransferase
MQREIDDEVNIKATDVSSVVRTPLVDKPSSVRARYRRFYRLMTITDVLAVVSAFYLAHMGWLKLKTPEPDLRALLLLATPIVVLTLYTAFHLYDAHRYSPAEEFRRIILAVSLAVAAIAVLSFGAKTQPDPSRGWLALSWVFAIVLALVTRRLWHAKIGHERAHGSLSFPTLIVGSNEEATHLLELMEAPAFGFRALGMVATAHSAAQAADGDPDTRILGTIAELREVIRECRAECVFVAATSLSTAEMKHVAKAVRLEGVEVRITATLPEVLSSRVAVQSLGGVTALSLQPVRLTGTQAALKRAFDVTLAGLGVVVLAPVFGIVAIAVRLSSQGPVLYRQTRVGHRGRPFTMLKFRTMKVGAHEMVEELRASLGVEDLLFKLEHDPRVTSTGRVLRKYSLDELPQLINVVRGEMSLVGPRPPLPEEVKKYEDWHFDRLEVPPGCSGLWQVSGRSDLSFDDSVRLDLFYIENWSLAYDLYILAKTVPALLRSRGAY